MNHLHIGVRVSTLALSLIVIGIAHYLDGFRTIIYLIPVIFIYSLIVLKYDLRKVKLYNFLNTILIIYIVLFLLTFIINYSTINEFRFLKEALFIFLSIFSAYLLVLISGEKVNQRITNVFVIYSIMVLLFSFITRGSFEINLINLILYSTSKYENTSCFIFGAFFVFFMVNRKYKLSIVSFFLILLTSKRIVLLASILLSILYLLETKLHFKILSEIKSKTRVNMIALFFIGFNISVLFILFALSEGTFDEFIVTQIGISPGILFMGRLSVFKAVFDYTGNIPIIGKGLGYTTSILESGTLNVGLELMHSDIIKYYIEFGLIGFSLLLFIFYRYGLLGGKSIYLVVYYNIIALTDNISIYMEVMLIFYFLLQSMLNTKKKNSFEGKKESRSIE